MIRRALAKTNAAAKKAPPRDVPQIEEPPNIVGYALIAAHAPVLGDEATILRGTEKHRRKGGDRQVFDGTPHPLCGRPMLFGNTSEGNGIRLGAVLPGKAQLAISDANLKKKSIPQAVAR
jgi:hypothetical protein